MKKKKLISYITAITVATGLSFGLTATKAKAQEAQIGNTGVTLSAGYAGEHFHYGESIGDQEHGWLNGFYVGAGYTSQNSVLGLGKLDLNLKDTFLTNSITYDGYQTDLATGAHIPSTTNTHENINKIEFEFGFNQALAQNISVGEYGILGYRYWDRQIKGIGGYTNDYNNGYAGIGVKSKISNLGLNGLNLGLDLSYRLSPAWSSINYMTNDFGTYDMGTAYNVRVEVPIEYNLGKNFSVSATPYYDYWHFTGSNIVNVSFFGFQIPTREPGSETNSLGFNLGINYKF
ncbi:hypothetical protein DESAMIL20_692 [Desulfurella amilsii]|uniref:Uncharacterized protein n=1 Tax=Desulfurella amilsii TaxID=1562698 RepID=A0A1X4XYA2_9BACT|nr:hypothetical protein [Desulfurella amilsii]OSS42508.1 hypothetical protein DESAMIL20_692 [Desulfurella amilsii]